MGTFYKCLGEAPRASFPTITSHLLYPDLLAILSLENVLPWSSDTRSSLVPFSSACPLRLLNSFFYANPLKDAFSCQIVTSSLLT